MPLVLAAIGVTHLQVEHVTRDESKKHPTMIEADAAEHRARCDLAELFELVENELPECGGHLQRVRRTPLDP